MSSFVLAQNVGVIFFGVGHPSFWVMRSHCWIESFVQVEKQMGGGSALPIIVADGPICAELEMLEESETEGSYDGEGERRTTLHPQDIRPPTHVADFLNELGWLFQNSQPHPRIVEPPKFLPSRQKHLLTFAVKRDWCAVVNKVLDILFGLVLAWPDKNSTGLVEIFGDETSLLHLAVERKCMRMVQLLLSYVPRHSEGGHVDYNDLKAIWKHGSQYSSIFSPNMSGPEGLTPLHVAASMNGAEGIIDALTSDPNQVSVNAVIYIVLT